MPRIRASEGPNYSFGPYSITWPESPDSGSNMTTNRAGGTVFLRSSHIADYPSREFRVKPVEHVQVQWIPNPFPASAYDAANPWYVENYLNAPKWVDLPFNVGSVFGWIPFPSSGVVGDLADKCFDAFYTQVPQEVDIANFLIDLRAMGDLIPQIQDTMLRTVSGGYLNYSFGWKPLIGDLRKLGRLSSTVQKRLRYLKDTRGRTTRLGYSSSFTFEGSSSHSAGGLYTATLVKSSCIFHAGGYLFHLLERLEGLEGQLRAFSAALGLNSPSRVAWERIPFSFVVDWFARTKAVTDSFTLNPFPGTWSVKNLSHSFTQQAEWVVRAPGASLTPWKTMDWGTISVRRYNRDQGLPVSSSRLTEGLSTGELALAAALIGAATK